MLRRRIVTTLMGAGMLGSIVILGMAAPAAAATRTGQISVDLPLLPPVELPGPPVSVGVGPERVGVGGPDGEVTIPPPSLPRPSLPAPPLTVPDLPAPNVLPPSAGTPNSSSPGDVVPAPTPAPTPAAGVDASPAPAPPGAARPASPAPNAAETRAQAAPAEEPVRVTASLDTTGRADVWSRIGSAAVSFGPWLMLLAIALIVRGVAASALRERRIARD